VQASLPTTRRVPERAWLAAALLVLGGLGGHAASAQPLPQQGSSMEERLRAQLRLTTTQLEQAQAQLVQLQAGAQAKPAGSAAPAAPAELDALKKELAQAKADAAAQRQHAERVDAAQGATAQQARAAVEKANAQIAQYRDSYNELLKMARASETERQRLSKDDGTRQTALQQCEAKNTKLYAVGQDILHAYETMDMSTVMAARQPFAAQSRVKFEQIAQDYGDKLYGGRFDERSAEAPVPAAAPAAAAPAPAPAPAPSAATAPTTSGTRQ
jgi:colicin import membrane protein